MPAGALAVDSVLMDGLQLLLVMDDLAHLEYGDGGEKPYKKENQQHEETKRAGIGCPIPFRRNVDAPGRWQKVAVQAGDDDDETLQPHADVDDDRNDPNPNHVQTHLAHPQQLRQRDVAQDEKRI